MTSRGGAFWGEDPGHRARLRRTGALFGEDLPTIRHLMANGLFGSLESVIPPITVPAWMSLATSQDPGSLGVYGFRNRVDYSYDGMATADARWFRATTLWDQIAVQGGRSVLIGVPPSSHLFG